MTGTTDIQLALVDDDLVADAIAASGGERTYSITHAPDHSYKRGPKGARGCQAIVGGVPCKQAKAAPVHNLPTMNETLTMDWKVYQGAKKKWVPYLIGKLDEAGVPRGMESVLVEGLCCFPTRAPHDQGNHRAFIEKALGDALAAKSCTSCGEVWNDKVPGRCEQCGNAEHLVPFIPNDTWSLYEFGNLQQRYSKGERWTELRFFPNALSAAF